jgi:hypothetical protein
MHTSVSWSKLKWQQKSDGFLQFFVGFLQVSCLEQAQKLAEE